MRLVLCIGTAAKTLAFLIAELIVALAVMYWLFEPPCIPTTSISISL